MVNLNIKGYRGQEYQQTVCVPGCGACCFYRSDEGIYVRNSEVKVISPIYGPLRVDQDLVDKSNKIFSNRHRKDPIVGLLPSKEGDFREIYDNFFGELIKGDPLNSVCLHLGGIQSDNTSALLSQREWEQLNEFFEKVIGKKLNTEYPPEGFEGFMCKKYNSIGPVHRSQYNCSLSLKIMPKIIRNHGAKPLEEMLNEPTLANRFKIAAEWLYKPRSV